MKTRKLTPDEESVLQEHLEQAMFIDDAPKYRSPSKRVLNLVALLDVLIGVGIGAIVTCLLWLMGRVLF